MTSIQQLEAALPAMSAKSREFAQSLINQAARRPLSDKQMYWVNKLAHEAVAPKPVVDVGELTGIIALFDRARQSLKTPAVVLNVPELAHLNEGGGIRISVASERAKFPGSLNVTALDRTILGDYGPSRAWYGRVHTDGRFECSGRAANDVVAIAGKLAAFAADPAGVAAEYGRLTGCCCFCNRPLKDERSTAVGYGKVCATRFGLAWGN